MPNNDLNAAAFPTLSKDQMASLAQCGGATLNHYRDGQLLIRAGDRDFKFFVVNSGEVQIFSDSDPPKPIVILGPGEFTGDVAHLSGEPSMISAVARGHCQALEVTSVGVREIISRFPNLGDTIMRAFIARRQILRERPDFTGLQVIGSRYSRDTFRVRDFLSRNHVLFTWIDLETDSSVKQLLRQFGISEAQTPVVVWGDRLLLRNPTDRALAEVLGIRRPLQQQMYDMVVVGAGPAGLGAAVYGTSEGLKTLVLEGFGPGGQAGRSMRIENYLGFPTGIPGGELAERAVLQAEKFGAQINVATRVTGLTFDKAYSELHLDSGEMVTSKCLLIATGAEWRRLEAEGCERFEGRGVYYAATLNEAPLCRGAEVVVVGGGNSAGQAAVFLAGIAHKIDLVIRSDDLYKDMSSYLAQRIEQTGNIDVLLNTIVRRMCGDDALHSVEIVNTKTRATQTINTPALFSFIGATPRSDWLPPEIQRDARQFVITGPELKNSAKWTRQRDPFLLETSHPGVFAAGDVRSGSVKRVASAVGEGAMAVQFVHAYLKEI